MRKPVIGVMGGSKAGESTYTEARQLGRLIAERGWILLTGGRNTGVSDVAAEGAKLAGGFVVGVLPDATDVQASPHLDLAIMTDAGDARNLYNVLSSDVVIACSGRLGTLSEIVFALNADKPVILLNNSLADAHFHKYIRSGLLLHAATPADAITHAATALARTNRAT
jgi:uncharacterized protein (TIGR00725 family)